MPRKFLVVVDDSPEFEAALRFASRRAKSTGGRVVMLRVLPTDSDAHWSGVREEIERQQRQEAEILLNRLGEEAQTRSGAAPVFLIEKGEAQAAIKKVVAADPEIKILVLAAILAFLAQDSLVMPKRLPLDQEFLAFCVAGLEALGAAEAVKVSEASSAATEPVPGVSRERCSSASALRSSSRPCLARMGPSSARRCHRSRRVCWKACSHRRRRSR